MDDALDGGGGRPDGVVRVAVKLRILGSPHRIVLGLVLLRRLQTINSNYHTPAHTTTNTTHLVQYIGLWSTHRQGIN